MKTKSRHIWHKAPAKGCRNPLAESYRFTVVRLSDKAERFTDQLPGPRTRRSPAFMVWDNRLNAEWID